MKRFFLTERNIFFAIIINSIIIFLMYFPENRDVHLFETIDHFFILFFLLEAIVKIYYYKPNKYFSDVWNVFDFILVAGSIPSLLVAFIDIPDTSILIALRAFRLFRIMRFIRFVPNVSKIIKGLVRALRASVFVFIALFILNFLIAIISCHFYGNLVPEYFRDPLISAYSTFQLFTVEGWNEIPALIAERLDNSVLSGLTRFYFVSVVFVGGIMGMSLANAVFVDEMTMDNNDLLEQKIDSLQEQIEVLTSYLKDNKNTNS